MTTGDDVPATPKWTLQAELEASGAKPHSRMSDLSRYMLAHYEELHDLVAVSGYSWEAITQIILVGKASLADRTGKPVTSTVAKLTWSRINQRRQKGHSPHKAALPALSATAQNGSVSEPQTAESSSQIRDGAFAGKAPLRTAIQPARPRGTVPPASPSKEAALSVHSLLSEDELDRKLADLARRQGGHKIPAPDIL